MNTELSELNLQDDFDEALTAPEATRWQLEKPEPLEVWVTMYSAGAPEEKFQARLLWRMYPDEAPSLKFRDPATGHLDLPTAWPKVRGFRPTSLDACVSWCSEGFALHPAWRTDPNYRWDSRGNVLLKVLRILQEELDTYYQGRYQ
jgi:hypothetical protein